MLRWTFQRTIVRLVLSSGILAGILASIYFLYVPGSSLMGDFSNYYDSTTVFLQTGQIPFSIKWTYTPITMAVFAILFSAVDFTTGFTILLICNLFSGMTIAYFSINIIKRKVELNIFDQALILLFAIFSIYPIVNMILGQINYILAAVITTGYFAYERDEDIKAGVYFALAALPKLFPGLLGVYLIRNQSFKAAIAAIWTGVIGIIIGALLFGMSNTRSYIEFLLSGGIKTGFFNNGPPPADAHIVTLSRPLSHIFPDASHLQYTVLSVLLMSVVLYVCYRDMSTLVDRLVAFTVTLIAMIIIIPPNMVYPAFVLFPTIPLLYLLDDPEVLGIYTTGILVMNIIVVPTELKDIVAMLPVQMGVLDWTMAIVTQVLSVASGPLIGLLMIIAGSLLQSLKTGGPDAV